MRFLVALLFGMAALGCAPKARPAVAPAPVDLAPADALFDAGCYRCLRQAIEIYERALATPAPPPGTREKAFTTLVLLALREKEIGLDAAPWLDRAARLAAPGEQRYLDLASRLPWTNAGASVDFEPPGKPLPLALAGDINVETSGPHPLLDQYLLVAVACGTGARGLTPDRERRLDFSQRSVRYRVGLCGVTRRALLEAVVAEDPRFVEAWFFIGRYEMASGVTPMGTASAFSREWLVRAVPPLTAAHDGLSEAPVITIALAGLMRSRTELGRALTLYDEALALRPTQRDGLLGRVITLTYLKRPDEAIATATRMIELGTWHIGSAYYWRAWNQYQKGQLAAGAPAGAAGRTLLVNDDVLTLSGMVAYDQKRPVEARADFEGALRMNPARCIARWYLGVIDLDEQAWSPAVDEFSQAGACFDRTARSIRAEIAQLPPDLPPDVRAQQTASLDESIDDSLRQAGRSFFNAAQASLRSGDRAAARAHLQTAAGYEEIRERAEALLKSLGTP
jgi:tetratricopeptide (TPR) repeat protein